MSLWPSAPSAIVPASPLGRAATAKPMLFLLSLTTQPAPPCNGKRSGALSGVVSPSR